MKPLTILAAVALVLATGCTDPGVATGSAHALDGDTVDVQTDSGTQVRVRLLGIDAPEVNHGETLAQCGAEAAAERLAALTAHRRATVVPDRATPSPDRYGRTLGYLEVDGRDVGEQLLDEGLVAAWKPQRSARPTRWKVYTDAEHGAQQSRKGSWAMCRKVGR